MRAWEEGRANFSRQYTCPVHYWSYHVANSNQIASIVQHGRRENIVAKYQDVSASVECVSPFRFKQAPKVANAMPARRLQLCNVTKENILNICPFCFILFNRVLHHMRAGMGPLWSYTFQRPCAPDCLRCSIGWANISIHTFSLSTFVL